MGSKFKFNKVYARKATSRLFGIMAGIACDDALHEKEVENLELWLNEYQQLNEIYPFKELAHIIKNALEDGILDSEERQEIVDWCNDEVDISLAGVTSQNDAVRMLHGFLQGIAMDGKITEKEVVGLYEWLKVCEDFKDCWPFQETWLLLDTIVADGIVDDQEKELLLAFCNEFSENSVDGAMLRDDFYESAWVKSYGDQIFQTISCVCEPDPNISFKGKTFCFTGTAKTAKRSELHSMVENAGGISAKSVTKKLDYLVIGSYSSPLWKFSTYGGKVEKAITNQGKGATTCIIMEDDFICQLPVKVV